MRVALYSRTGPPHDVLTLVERPCPEPRSGEVRVRVAWSGVNPSDVKSRAGTRSKTLPYAEVTPHSEGAGAIDALARAWQPIESASACGFGMQLGAVPTARQLNG